MAVEICAAIADGLSLKKFCDQTGKPDRVTVRRWLDEKPDFRIKYARAREEQADHYADEIIDISDSDKLDPNDKRIRVDARKWVASKLKPKSYGDKTTTELVGQDGGPIRVGRIERVIIDPTDRDATSLSPPPETEEVQGG